MVFGANVNFLENSNSSLEMGDKIKGLLHVMQHLNVKMKT